MLIGADDDGLAQGSSLAHLRAMLAWARLRLWRPALMVAQATLPEVCLHIRQRRFGGPSDAALSPHDT